MDANVINSLNKERQELQSRLTYLDELILKLSKPESKNTHTLGSKINDGNVLILNGSNLTSTVTDLFKSEARFLHVREIADLLEDQGYDVGDHKDFCNKRLSPLLSRLKREKIVVNYSVGGKNTNTFWGSPKWLDAQGKPKDGHGHNHKYIATKQTVEI